MKNFSLRHVTLTFIFFTFFSNFFIQNSLAQNLPQDPLEAAKAIAESIDTKTVGAIPVLDHGRIKPLQTFARETVLFLTGKYTFMGLDPIHLYFSIITSPESDRFEFINIRSVTLRTQLGFDKEQRYFSVAQIQKSPLMQLAEPLKAKEEENRRSLEPEEKKVLEVYNQFWLVKGIQSGEHFFRAVDFSSLDENTKSPHGGSMNSIDAIEKAKAFLNSILTLNRASVTAAAQDLTSSIKTQKLPDLLRPQLNKIDVEIFYNNSHLFFISAVLFLLIGISLFSEKVRTALEKKSTYLILTIPSLLLAIGFAIRVYITGFAPVTNMFGTMIWVSLGVSIFSFVLLYLYRNYILVAGLLIGSATLLFITESLPIILSPDLDPIVAVLRSNLWLTIHVLTIVISYAAFTITMILGNVVAIRSIIYNIYNDTFIKEYATSIYRMMQLGVFLLSVGIILGGVWADYSWGRFWGWDPKETWALIADIGYLAVLHARHVGWLGAFGVSIATPLAYLLVVMAWYGVNFILASGLHSYGFSSGGAAMVLTFVIVQLIILGTALALRYMRNMTQKSA